MNNNIPQNNAIQKERIPELDALRGLCVLLMILDHALFDLGYVFLQQWFPAGGDSFLYQLCLFCRDIYWLHPLRLAAHNCVVAGFLLTCGVSCSFSRSNLRRGLKLLAVAVLLSLVTWLMDRISGQQLFFIRFGILHMLALSILTYALLSRKGSLPVLIAGLLILAVYWIPWDQHLVFSGYIPFVLGLCDNYYSADYYPVLQWMGWLLLSAWLGRKLYPQRRSLLPRFGRTGFCRFLSFPGRHALIVYLLHQPLIYGLLYLLGLLLI